MLPGLGQSCGSADVAAASSHKSSFPLHFPGTKVSVSLDVIQIARKRGMAQDTHGKNGTSWVFFQTSSRKINTLNKPFVI